MTLHWWMHWFWITKVAVVVTLLVVSPIIAAPTFEPYALPIQQEQRESEDDSLSPDWSTQQHMSADDLWDLYHFSTTSSVNELSTSAVELWPSDPPELVDVSVGTYPPLDTETASEVFTSPNSADQIVPVQKSTTLIPKLDSEKLNISEEAKVSIRNVPKSSTTEDSSLVIGLKNVNSEIPLPTVSVENTSSSETKISLDAVVNSFNSNSQSVDKPIVNVPRLITRDLKNSSESSHNLSSAVASRELDSHSLPSPLPRIFPPTARTGKAAGYFSQPLHLHPLFISTGLPSESSSSSPPSDFLQGPKSVDDINAGLTGDITIDDSGESDSRIVWIKPYDDGFETNRKNPIVKSEDEHSNIRRNPLEEAEMGDGPYNPPESSTVVSPKMRNLGESPVPSDDFVVPTSRPVETDHEPPTTGRIIVKVTPPLLSTSKAVNLTSQAGKLPDNGTRNGLLPPVVVNSEGNLSVSIELNRTSTVEHEGGSTVEGKNVTRTSDEDDETTVMPTVVPVSNRVQAPAPPGSHHGLDAASITGISLGILVFAALIGAVSFVLYRRRFLNKPQTLNDKCSNPDSSGYIDDSTLRENSEEMYSLDNDSFLNSLEAMTIQNYWTDNRVNSTRKFGVLTEMVH